MTFNLTESPFIRAGRQYSVRVRFPLAIFKVRSKSDMTTFQRISGHTPTTGRLCETSLRKTSLHMVSLPCFSRTLVTSLQDCILHAVFGSSVPTRTERTLVVEATRSPIILNRWVHAQMCPINFAFPVDSCNKVSASLIIN